MVDLSLLAGAASSLRVASDVASSLVGLRDYQLIQNKVIELQRLIIDAQSSATSAQMQQMDLVSRIGELQAETAAFTNWERISVRYRLVGMGGETFTYRLNDGLDEPIHFACPTCFENRKKSVLQNTASSSGQKLYKCEACKSEYWLGTRIPRSSPRRGPMVV